MAELRLKRPDGEPDVVLRGRRARDARRRAQEMMRERDISFEDAVNEIIREGLQSLEDKVPKNPAVKRSSNLLSAALGDMAMARGFPEVEQIFKEHAGDTTWMEPKRRYLLEPEHHDELEARVQYLIEFGGKHRDEPMTRHEAFEEVLAGGDQTMFADRMEKVLRNMKKGLGPDATKEQIEIVTKQLAAARLRERPFAAASPWFKAVRQLGSMNGSAQRFLEMMTLLKFLPPIEGEEDDLTRTRDAIFPIYRQCRVFDVGHANIERLVEKTREAMKFVLDESVDLLEETEKLGVPEALPYPEVFIGFGYEPLDLEGLRVLGIIISASMRTIDLLVEFRQKSPFEPESIFDKFGWPSINLEAVYPKSERSDRYLTDISAALFVWLAHGLVSTIHHHRTTVVSSPQLRGKEQRSLESLRRKLELHVVPRAFYEAELSDRIYVHQVRKLAPYRSAKAAMMYRTDRRAHERCHIQRGPAPASREEELELEALKQKLLKRGYTFYDREETASVEDEERLRLRAQPPKRSGEWLAILSVHVRECIMGPEDAPYIPRVDKISHIPDTFE